MANTRARARAAAKEKATHGQRHKLQEVSEVNPLKSKPVANVRKVGGGEEEKEEKEPPQSIPSRKRRLPQQFPIPKARRTKVYSFDQRYGNHRFGLPYNLFPTVQPPPKSAVKAGIVPSAVVPTKPPTLHSSSLPVKSPSKSKPKPQPQPPPQPQPKSSLNLSKKKTRSVTKFIKEKPATRPCPPVRE